MVGVGNLEYLKKVPGIIKLCEIIFGIISISLIADYSFYIKFHMLTVSECFFLGVAICYFLITVLIVINDLSSSSTEEKLNQTLFEFLYHALGFIMYFSGSVAVLAGVNDYLSPLIYRARRDAFLAAGSFGIMNSVLYARIRLSPSGLLRIRMMNALNQVSGPLGSCVSCPCIPSLNFNFLRTREGFVKLLETILGSVCQSLLVNYGLTYSVSLGSTYRTFVATCSSGVMTSLILLITYVFSNKSFQLIRQSLFEITFNGTICFLYVSSSGYLAFAVHTFLYPVYKFTSLFQLYPEMSMTYITGLLVGIIHGYDCWLAYKKFH